MTDERNTEIEQNDAGPGAAPRPDGSGVETADEAGAGSGGANGGERSSGATGTTAEARAGSEAGDVRSAGVAGGAAGSESETGTADAEADAEDQRALESLQTQLGELNDRHLRLAAEFDNYRRRSEREREELRGRAQADFAKRMLDALDDLQRVADYDADATSVDALLEGVRLVEKKLRHALESMGLEPIQAEGEFFNPSSMEALMTLPAEHPEEDEVVADVFQKGYRFRGTLIRPARVRVKKYDQENDG